MKKIFIPSVTIVLLLLIHVSTYSDNVIERTLPQVIEENNRDISLAYKITVSCMNQKVVFDGEEAIDVLKKINQINFTNEKTSAEKAHAGIAIHLNDIRLTIIRITDNGKCYLSSAYPTASSAMPPAIAWADPDEVSNLIIELLDIKPELQSYHSDDIGIQYNGKLINLEKPVYIFDGAAYVSVRDIFEELGFEVDYDERNNYVKINEVIASDE